MGEVIISAVLSRGLSTPEDIQVGELNPERAEYLKSRHSVVVAADNRLAVKGADIVVLAVKPQDMVTVMAELRDQLEAGQLVMSVAAGVRLNSLFVGLNHGAIVRVMPNIPAQVGQGMSVWAATAEVSEPQREMTASILGAMGREIYVDDEQYLDMATAVSGSGPAYFFYMVEALTTAAMEVGLPPEVAREMVLQTLTGSAAMLRESGRTATELRQMVTSPAGTTAAALDRLEAGGYGGLISQAVQAAFERAKELGS
jgi:pyrroline-5-carboxylate reductase